MNCVFFPFLWNVVKSGKRPCNFFLPFLAGKGWFCIGFKQYVQIEKLIKTIGNFWWTKIFSKLLLNFTLHNQEGLERYYSGKYPIRSLQTLH